MDPGLLRRPLPHRRVDPVRPGAAPADRPASLGRHRDRHRLDGLPRRRRRVRRARRRRGPGLICRSPSRSAGTSRPRCDRLKGHGSTDHPSSPSPFLLLAGACASSGNDPEGADGGSAVDLGDVELVAALTPFDSCDALLTHLTEEASERVGPYGLDGDGPFVPGGRRRSWPSRTQRRRSTATAAGGDDSSSPQALPGAVHVGRRPRAPTTRSRASTSPTSSRSPAIASSSSTTTSSASSTSAATSPSPAAPSTCRAGAARSSSPGDRVLALGSDDGGFDDLGAEDTSWAPYGYGASAVTEVDISDLDAPTDRAHAPGERRLPERPPARRDRSGRPVGQPTRPSRSSTRATTARRPARSPRTPTGASSRRRPSRTGCPPPASTTSQSTSSSATRSNSPPSSPASASSPCSPST